MPPVSLRRQSTATGPPNAGFISVYPLINAQIEKAADVLGPGEQPIPLGPGTASPSKAADWYFDALTPSLKDYELSVTIRVLDCPTCSNGA
jgi:hypothetical protein